VPTRANENTTRREAVDVDLASKTVPAIDVHSHYIPKTYRKWLEDSGLISTDGFALPPWDMEQQVEDMDRTTIGAAVLSLSSPDIHWGDSSKARSLARDANEVAAEAVAAYPNRFGFYATLPLPDVEASLAEIEYALDVLHADGVKFYSNSNGVYLGDPKLEPIFTELGRRNAVVTVHPVRSKAVPDNVLPGVPYPLFEFQFDTTRAVANMIFNGTLRRNPGIKFVCPHMGALFPLLGGRMEGIAKLMVHYATAPEGFEPPDVKGELGSLYYDTAGGFNLPVQIPALLGIGRPERMLCGSDYPFTPATVGGQMLDDVRNTDHLTEEQKIGVLRTNALGLFPRLS
jgi:predicted TIM-barrel fold metal-dependent hydrolase